MRHDGDVAFERSDECQQTVVRRSQVVRVLVQEFRELIVRFEDWHVDDASIVIERQHGFRVVKCDLLDSSNQLSKLNGLSQAVQCVIIAQLDLLEHVH